MKKKNIISFLVPFLIVAGISTLGIFSSVMKDIDNKLYDAALQIKPMAEISGKFLNVHVDDTALDLLKMYPLKRSTLADGMLVLKEFGAETILLDTQLVDPSTPGLNSTKFNQLPDIINQAKDNTFSMSEQLIRAYANGQLTGEDPDEVDEYLTDLSWEYDDIYDTLIYETNQVALDYDEYVANIFSFIGNVYVTNDFEEGKVIEPEFQNYLEETQSLNNIVVHDDPFSERKGSNPAIFKIMSAAKGSGFVETLLDGDGKTRKSDIILRKGDYYYPHLSLRSYLDHVGNPEIHIYKNKVILKGVKEEGMEPFDLKIPLASDGSMVIDWAGKDFNSTFDNLNFYTLYHHDLLFRSLREIVTKLTNNPNTSRFAGRDYNIVLTLFQMADEAKQEGVSENFQDYIDYREEIVKTLIPLFEKSDSSIDTVFRSELTEVLSLQDFTDEENAAYLSLADEVDKIFETGRDTLNNLIEFRETLKKQIEGSIITFGYTATSTFDIGSNPFEKKFFNMGIYPTLYNNFLNKNFITLCPMWIPIVLAFIFALLSSLIIKRNEAKGSIFLGLAMFLVIIFIYLTLFILFNIYIPLLVPALSFFMVFIQKISGKLISTSRDKAFIRNAFGQYLSEDVIMDIIDDPSKLKLGGEEKDITAFFTDVKGFSTISEKLTPDELVSLLNEYLTAMSDIALQNKGTIDKYEGDAIIGFFGAPAPLPDHATKAVIAAIRMKEIEEKLNIKFIKDGISPSPLLTRIGINSGPCVVGNMGTPRKMDYTMMGSDVNIAARLEGVNKQYGTWILASERTMQKADDIFLSRRLDRVRVVGINNPIRLYNPIAIREEATETQTQMVEKFEEALTLFEQREWHMAKSQFKHVLEIEPEDKPSIRYIQLCDKFMENEPEESWDGVFNLTSK